MQSGRGVGVKVVSGRRQRLMVGIISCTDESVEGGVARGRPDTTAPHPSSQSHAILPPADIHHPVRAWWIVGDHWSEKIPLNSGHSIWCVTVNSTHGNCERPRSAAPVTVHPSSASMPHARPARDGGRAIFHLFSHLLR